MPLPCQPAAHLPDYPQALFDRPVYYIDTDLPEVIATKQQMVTALVSGRPTAPRGHYELHPLNTLDVTVFQAIVDSFPPGPLVIVNEGLLMYLGKEEKLQLGQIIRKTSSAEAPSVAKQLWRSSPLHLAPAARDIKYRLFTPIDRQINPNFNIPVMQRQSSEKTGKFPFGLWTIQSILHCLILFDYES